MDLFDVIAVLISLSAVFSWLNTRFLKLPTAIGLMMMALAMSLVLLLPLPLSEYIALDARELVASVDFNATVLHGMLSFLLFAGALHVNIHDLAEHRNTIAALTTIGVFLASLIISLAVYLVFLLLGFDIPYIYCLLFGALISPTDPIAVLGILKSAGAPKSLATKITGESLFNDGVAVVLFMVLFDIAIDGQHISLDHVLVLFAQEAIGGAIFGLIVGQIALEMLRRIDNYQAEVLITLAVASGGYAIAEHVHLSAPIAVVVAGLMIGNQGLGGAMSNKTREHLDSFWELVDESLNAVLFVLIGLEVLALTIKESFLLAGALLIPLVLLARALSIGVPLGLYRGFRNVSPGTVAVLTWGGIRGGISVALALSLPPGATRDLILTVTYMIVVFSIMVQGLTLAPVIRAFNQSANREFGAAEPEDRAPEPE
ncbi:cation:proton antiporter [Thiorhodovibrio frisius]|uniref:NhaP-type Na+(K+)/H+ antiporter n=1 Tax=Thiorhodovibrio frisius TaxID=631362 RepID=H8Z5X2_9GAMM|nr:sodium:proton antiporter [Thiorhodovibrio frisius]EIC20622.1 NhaP-type Na+(K+)/H+ antiporter [Thiorhodovibrio frisius]WPL21371.1 potassium/proton antiporter [Thiorhodovibrio frisius]